ncbi:MAG TPA: glycosyltransferase [Flavisolibacter sp.]|jgi:glycosyltransferase involved in cell wall biosynthesis|nr:glycosyltransferase [Flavisolibacter sp.]
MTQHSPLVSICIPTYNAGDYFEKCLQSAVNQTYQNIEILISDDGSTDATLSVVETYQQQYPHIRLVKNNNPGLVTNWNHCIEQAGGEWIKFLFQDDLLLPACVEKMLAACMAYNLELGLCRRRFIIHDDVSPHTRYQTKYKRVVPERFLDDEVFITPERLAADMAELLPENALGEPTCFFFRKTLLEKTGMFDTDFRNAVDLEFILRLGLYKGLAFVSEPLAFFRVHGRSETSANLVSSKDALLRHIAAIDGDNILLFYKILHDPAFRLLKEAVGEDVLQLHINYYYQSGCKHKGQRIFNKALEPIRQKYKGLRELNYSIFRYMYYRKKYKQWIRQNR